MVVRCVSHPRASPVMLRCSRRCKGAWQANTPTKKGRRLCLMFDDASSCSCRPCRCSFLLDSLTTRAFSSVSNSRISSSSTLATVLGLAPPRSATRRAPRLEVHDARQRRTQRARTFGRYFSLREPVEVSLAYQVFLNFGEATMDALICTAWRALSARRMLGTLKEKRDSRFV